MSQNVQIRIADLENRITLLEQRVLTLANLLQHANITTDQNLVRYGNHAHSWSESGGAMHGNLSILPVRVGSLGLR